MLSECTCDMMRIAEQFKECQTIFQAIGDETRQKIILVLLEGDYEGMRVGEVTQKTWLSRPAVSHHLRILKDAGLIQVKKEGTKNYYYMDSNLSQWKKMTALCMQVNDIVKRVDEEKRSTDIRSGGQI